MEASMKYPLNPLAACFIPLSMKAHTENINEDLHSFEIGKSIPFYAFKLRAQTNKSKTNYSQVKNLKLRSTWTTSKDLCFTSKSCEVNECVHETAMSEKLISDEASIDRSEDRTSNEKVDLMELIKDMTGNCSMHLERTPNMAYENTDPFGIERTSDMDENADSIKMNSTLNMAHENSDSETVQAENLYTILGQNENLLNYDIEPGQYESISSTESVQSTRSYQSDYGTDVDNIDTEDCSEVSSGMLPNLKSHETIENEQATELVSGGSERDLNRRMKRLNSLSLYLTAVLSSILPSKNGKRETSPKKFLKAGYKLKEECACPPMFGWIVPFEHFGNPLNLTGICEINYVHTTYEHAIYNHTAYVPTIYRKSPVSEKLSIDSGHCSDEDELSSSVHEVNTLEQCSSELDSIIKDVFDCVDKSLSLCDEKPHTADNKNSEVWITAKETEVLQIKDSPLIDDGYHPLLQEITSEDEVDVGISIIEKLLGEALTFGDKNVNKHERYSSQSSCIPPCSVWCTNVPPPVIDTYRRFIKKIESDSEPVDRNVVNEKNVFRKQIYKRCFSANDTPKYFEVLRLASSWEPKAQFYRKDLSAFKNSKDTANSNKNLSSNFSSGQPTNPLKEGSDTWSLYDGADSLWQPLPDCVLSIDQSQKYAHKKGARIMRRQKSVG